MNWLKTLLSLILIGILWLQTPSFSLVKSMAVMGVYSVYEANTSMLHEAGVKLVVPGGIKTEKKDWYPFVMTFNTGDAFSNYIGRQVEMTILYNFGYFPMNQGYASFYDQESPYYTSFYGAYSIKTEDGLPFGFRDGEADEKEIGQIPAFDMKYLVLEELGAVSAEFSYKLTRFEQVNLFNEKDWQVFDADMIISGAMHTCHKDRRTYIQYGRPPIKETLSPDFEPVAMKGRIYGKYYPEKNISIFFYCIAREEKVIEEWEKDIMVHSKIIFK